MSALRHYLQLALVLGILVVSAAGLYNTFGENSELVAHAKLAACPNGYCGMTRMDRSPFAQSYVFSTPARVEIHVSCTRSAVFFGDYACKKE